MTKKLKFSAIIFTLVLAFTITTSLVYATTLGGSWDTSSVLYYAADSEPYSSQDIQGKTNWNNVTTTINYSRTTLTNAVVSSIYDYYGSTGWNAMGIPGPDPYSGTYTYGSLKFNRTYMDSYSSSKKTAIACHESGHILGLAHNYYYDSDNTKKSIMYGGGSSVYFDQWGLTAPTSVDTTDINNLYP